MISGFDTQVFIIDFMVGTFRLCLALGIAITFGIFAVKLGLADKHMVSNSYYAPIKNFFQRYGRLALWVLLAGFLSIIGYCIGRYC